MSPKTISIIVVIIIVAIAAAIFLTQQRGTPQAGATTQNATSKQIYVIYDIGGRGDLSFNDMAYLGASKAAQDFGLQLVQLQSKTQDDYLPNLRLAAKNNPLLIVAVGFLMTDAVKEAATEFPNAHFVIIDGFVNKSNVLSIQFKENEGSALVGALAALTAYYFNCTKVGIVLGMDIPVLWKFEIGYAYGVRWAQQYIAQKFGKNVTFTIYYVYTGSFNDPAKGKQAAQAMLAQGVCVIYQAAGATGLGVFDAVAEAGQKMGRTMGPPFAIGVDADQDYIKPGFILASMMKRVDVAVYKAAQMAVNGQFKGGLMLLGLKDGGVSVSTLDDLNQFLQLGIQAGAVKASDAQNIINKVKEMRDSIPQWIWQAVDELKEEIISGKVQVPLPTTRDQLNYYRQVLGLTGSG
ncbi:BMP family lipoprotein [Thermoproteus tenax]|uniref:Sugar transport protein n=1 Tax=Thermoproteus tenax (strain ATCC 35583 / DSM 2078 / JCM 9277 / NBRC 100435 / Kra 1) TaxID=768679 RepID=G4RJL6_THETK|nr:BMP family ABC transporter substrate-binding protein [Thermoproteus tenax]CCC81761.1 sugar transport protein [Thermoproteus tenax Kra 1]